MLQLCNSQMCDDMEEVNKFKNTLTQEQQDCMEVLKCRSYQPTLLCVVNGAQSIKKHFCKTVDSDVVNAFFKWMVDDVLKPTNVQREQKNDYVFVAHNGSAYDSQFIYRNAHDFFCRKNVNVLIHNNRMTELKI